MPLKSAFRWDQSDNSFAGLLDWLADFGAAADFVGISNYVL
jgi:hypothetical protein